MQTYKPNPIDTQNVAVGEDILEFSEVLAKNTHDIWSMAKINDGWSYGESLDAVKKLHPCLVPYGQLPESEKDYDRNTALETLKVLIAFGYEIKRIDK